MSNRVECCKEFVRRIARFLNELRVVWRLIGDI